MRTTVEGTATTTGPAGPRFLLLSAPSGLRVVALPEAGELVLGRGAECDVVLDHPKISRQHARLRVGATCTIADLGSRNGTVFRGARLPAGEEREIAVGESFAAGPFSLLLMPAGASPPAAASGLARLSIEDPAAPASPLLTAVARAPVSVLIQGETGVGKELLALTLHRLSGRAGLMAINCAALSEPLLESELFGHERGAFTGADRAKPGLLEAASGGTVFLDEIGEMTAGLQAKLLRAIEAREVLRVGGVKPVPIDVRFFAATHRDLLAGSFRRDLFYRLAGITLEIPPLRRRRARIGQLALELLAQAAERGGLPPPALTAAATARLVAHDWPGNVRELRNVVERALLLAGGGAIGAEHILFDTAQTAPAAAPDDEQRARLVEALDAAAGNQTRAARALGMSRATFVNKLAIHRIPRPRKR